MPGAFPLVASLTFLPLLFRFIPMFVPAHYLEPYAWWDAAKLNTPAAPGARQLKWNNMGYWEDTNDFSEANEALARKLLTFANAPPGGSVLDIAHGSGESLVLHLSSDPPPAHLHALTSQPSDTRQAKSLVDSLFPPGDRTTDVVFFTGSAILQPGSTADHPLNPMRGFMGESKKQRRDFDTDEDDDDGDEDEEEEAGAGTGLTGRKRREDQAAFDAGTPASAERRGPPPYDLIYILDAIYHFPPSVPYFLHAIAPFLAPTTGVIAYTDVLPPVEGISNILGQLVLPPLLGVPARNLVNRVSTLEEYKAMMERRGYTDIEIEDWSDGVFPGFARNLQARGGIWTYVGKVAEKAGLGGWRFIAVRARRVERLPQLERRPGVKAEL